LSGWRDWTTNGFRLEHPLQSLQPKVARVGVRTKQQGFWSGGRISINLYGRTALRQYSPFPQEWVADSMGCLPGIIRCDAQLAPVILFPIFYKFEPSTTTI